MHHMTCMEWSLLNSYRNNVHLAWHEERTLASSGCMWEDPLIKGNDDPLRLIILKNKLKERKNTHTKFLVARLFIASCTSSNRDKLLSQLSATILFLYIRLHSSTHRSRLSHKTQRSEPLSFLSHPKGPSSILALHL